jgi:hypothetical protein
MSKLVELLKNSEVYSRLNTIAGHSPNTANPKNFSVRKQSDVTKEIRQTNAVDFIPNTYQNGFNVDKPSLSVAGFQKSVNTQDSDFTGTTTGAPGTNVNSAFDTYYRFAIDSSRKNYNSKLVHRYLATDNNEKYLTKNSTSAGVVLGYTPA